LMATTGKDIGLCNRYYLTALENREARRAKPQPWIALKFAVGLTFAIIGYASYVYVGRLCVPMIRRDSGAYGGRVTGSEYFRWVSTVSVV
jgi:palmitoyltransferase